MQRGTFTSLDKVAGGDSSSPFPQLPLRFECQQSRNTLKPKCSATPRRLQVESGELSNHRLCGRPPLWTSLTCSTCLPLHSDKWKMSTCLSLHLALQWGAAGAEIKVPSGQNTELKRSPFKAWSRSVYSHTCYAYCQEFLPLLLPVPV